MSHGIHVIFGAGPVGCHIARALVAKGLSVRAVNRSGSRPGLMPAEVEMRAADLRDAGSALAAAEGAATLYQALNPAYHQWGEIFPELQAAALSAAKAAGAVYVSVENLYMYDASAVMSEDSRIAPVSGKGELRRRMADEVQAAHARGELRAVALRSSDYYGPGVLVSAFGERFFGGMVSGGKAQVTGSLARPHSIAYIEDVGRAAAELGTRDDLVGKVWFAPHAPAATQGTILDAASDLLGAPVRASVVTPAMMRMAGLFLPLARASVEMMYQFTRPFVVDSSRSDSALGLSPTSLETGLRKTLAWHQTRMAESGGRGGEGSA